MTTHYSEIDKVVKSPLNLVSNSSVSLSPNNQIPNPKDELLKSDMMKKLSLKEKWLNDQAAALKEPKVVPMEVEQKVPEGKKKDDKKSFLTGILSSVKHLIKPEKSVKNKSASPSSDAPSVDLDKLLDNEKINVDNFDELVVESDKPEPGCVNKRIQAFLKKQKSEDIREGADDILNNIKDGNDRLAKQMRDMEQKRFSDNMQAIKSSVVDSKVASMKEMNISKYFPAQQDKKPPAVAKNRDVKALKDVNLSKYFPQSSSPTSAHKVAGSPTGQSGASSAAASPLMPRKNVNEIDLANYFPGTPVMSRKTSVSSPPSSPMTEALPSFERRFSISSIPPPPPPPIAKKNVLALQSVKKRAPSNENVDSNASQAKKEPSPPKAAPQKKPNKNFNMFDQLVDGANDLVQIEEKIEIDLDSFESLIEDEIFDNSPSKSKSGTNEISPEVKRNQSPDHEPEPVKKSNKKSKSKSPKKNLEKEEFLDKLAIDPKIFKNLTKEYQRLLGELERSSNSPETDTSNRNHVKESSPDRSRLDNKRKSPQRFEDRKKFKEEFEEIKKIDAPVLTETEEDSVLARLERKYRRGSLKSNEETQKVDEGVPETTEPKIEIKKPDEPRDESTLTVLERLELKLKKKRELAAKSFEESELEPVIKEPQRLNSTALVKEQFQKQEVQRTNIEQDRKAKVSPPKKPEMKAPPLKQETKASPPRKQDSSVKKQGSPVKKQNSPAKQAPKLSPPRLQEAKASTPKNLETKTQQTRKPEVKPSLSMAQEVKCFDSLLSHPKEGIDDIFTEFEMTERETEKALKDFQDSFDKIAKEESAAVPVTPKLVSTVKSLPKENDFGFKSGGVIQLENISKTKSERKQQSPVDIKPKGDQKQKRKSLHLDLAEIDCGISERPLNLDNLFPRQSSIEEIPDSPKSSGSNDEAKVVSGKDSAYSGSRKSSALERDIEADFMRSQGKPAYINVLKEISCGLIGLEEEPLEFIEPPVKVKAEIKTEPVKQKVKENAHQSYTRVLQDISSTLVGLDLYGVETPKKNYSQMIPPFVHDQVPLKKVPSANSLEVPNGNKIHEFHPNVDEVVDITIPVPPVRRHRSVESSDAPEYAARSRRPLVTGKSFDLETVSGRTSKNSTEYYDHYYPTNIATRRLEKYDPTARKDSLEGRTRTRQKAIDDLMVKSAKSRMYDVEPDIPIRYNPEPLRRQYETRRDGSEPTDASALLQRSHMLHERKENFMRDQMHESSNPYIREMMKQDFDNPIDISDIKFIRQNPSVQLPTTSHLSSYRPSSYVSPTRPTSGYTKHSVMSHAPISTPSYSRPSTIHAVSSYKSAPTSSLGYLSPTSSTAAHILTKSHTLSPPSSAYQPRTRPISSLADPHTSSSRLMTHTRPTTSYSSHNKKTSGASRDACVIS